MSTTGYQHDVFVSLSHSGEWMEWLEERFINRFKHHLWNELGDDPKCYVARHRMFPGDTWPLELAANHARSRTLLAICTNPYRCSQWCCLEFSMMRAREVALGFRTMTRPEGLIVPVVAHDCHDSPGFLAGVEPLNIVGLTYRYLSSGSIEEYQLDKSIEKIALSVAKAINVAPDYDESWEKLNCERFLELFEQRIAERSQRTVPR